MRQAIRALAYLIGALLFSVGEILLFNQPFGWLTHLHLIILYFAIFLILYPDPIMLLPLPISGLILEPFTSFPYGLLTLSLVFSFVTTYLVIQNLVTNRSLWAIVLISGTPTFINQTIIFITRLILFHSDNNSAILAILSNFLSTVIFDTILTSVGAALVFFAISRSTRRFNPKYILSSKRWQ